VRKLGEKFSASEKDSSGLDYLLKGNWQQRVIAATELGDSNGPIVGAESGDFAELR
jgi:hypothetical protein